MIGPREPRVLCARCGKPLLRDWATCPNCDASAHYYAGSAPQTPRQNRTHRVRALAMAGTALAVALTACTSTNSPAPSSNGPIANGTATSDTITEAINAADLTQLSRVHSETTLTVVGDTPELDATKNATGVDLRYLAVTLDGVASLDASNADVTISSNLPKDVSPTISLVTVNGNTWTRKDNGSWDTRTDIGNNLTQVRYQAHHSLTDNPLTYRGTLTLARETIHQYSTTSTITSKDLAELDALGQGLLPTAGGSLKPLIGTPLTVTYALSDNGELRQRTINLDLLPVLTSTKEGKTAYSGATAALFTQSTTWASIGQDLSIAAPQL